MMALWGYQLQKYLNNIKIITVRQNSIPKPPLKEKKCKLGVKICLTPRRLTLKTTAITKSFETFNCK